MFKFISSVCPRGSARYAPPHNTLLQGFQARSDSKLDIQLGTTRTREVTAESPSPRPLFPFGTPGTQLTVSHGDARVILPDARL